MKFQSTSPARGTTAKRIPRFFWRLNFNPRPPCGGRQANNRVHLGRVYISIHVPRAGDDDIIILLAFLLLLFQSTSPVRGTTLPRRKTQYSRKDFNPRPPCGGRQTVKPFTYLYHCISIHVPRAGDDAKPKYNASHKTISIHVPRAGDDS